MYMDDKQNMECINKTTGELEVAPVYGKLHYTAVRCIVGLAGVH